MAEIENTIAPDTQSILTVNGLPRKRILDCYVSWVQILSPPLRKFRGIHVCYANFPHEFLPTVGKLHNFPEFRANFYQ